MCRMKQDCPSGQLVYKNLKFNWHRRNSITTVGNSVLFHKDCLLKEFENVSAMRRCTLSFQRPFLVQHILKVRNRARKVGLASAEQTQTKLRRGTFLGFQT